VLRDLQPNDKAYTCLGMPLARWVEQNIIDPLTGGRHMLLRETIRQLASHASNIATKSQITPKLGVDGVTDQISLSLHAYPRAMAQLTSLRQIMSHQLDMTALVRQPGELLECEDVWAGREWKKRKAAETPPDERESRDAKESGGKEEAVAWLGGGTKYEGPEMLQYVMDHTAGVVSALDRGLREGRPEEGRASSGERSRPLKRKRERHGGVQEGTRQKMGEENPKLRDLRMNLLALAKRAPAEAIARLPADMVPEHIRSHVPTLG
jgi:bromodomain-containing protein 7